MDDNNTNPVAQSTVSAPTFTQDDVDRIVRGRVNEVNAKVNDLTQQLTDANAKISDMASSLVKYQQSAFLTSLGVPTELQDFVAFEANKQVSGDVTFEQAAQNFIKDKGSLYGIGVSQNNANADNSQAQQTTSDKGTENNNDPSASNQQNTESKNSPATSDKSGTESKGSKSPASTNNAQGKNVSTSTDNKGQGNTDTSTDIDAAVQEYLKQHHLN